MSKSSKGQSQAARDNRSNQLNTNNAAYWQSRGLPAPPDAATPRPSPPTTPAPPSSPSSKKTE